MENNEVKSIPYFVHEGMMARQERTIKRLWILCIIIFLAFVASNAAWIWYENQFMDVVTTNEITQDVNSEDGGNAIINDGVHINGEEQTDG